jgi:hypothetical protein
MLTPQGFDANRRWYEECEAMRERALQVANENVALRQHIVHLEQRVTAAELTVERIGDLVSHDLTRLAHHHQALLTAIVAELRARHVDISEELIAPRVHELEDQLTASKTRAFDLGEQLHDLDRRHQRLLEHVAEAEAERERETATGLEPNGAKGSPGASGEYDAGAA